MTARPSSNDSLGLLVPGGGRNLDQLKQEVQRRADRNLPPLGGIAPEDARAALLQINSLEREEWSLAFSGIADRYLEQAQSLEARDRTAAARRPRPSWRMNRSGR